jgi:hypothetical protein
MTEREDRARRLDAENRDEFAIRHQEASLEAQEHALEREMKEFEHSEAEAKREIEAEWRSEHHGHDPQRPPAWRTTDDAPIAAAGPAAPVAPAAPTEPGG